jgi:hypothetical protein
VSETPLSSPRLQLPILNLPFWLCPGANRPSLTPSLMISPHSIRAPKRGVSVRGLGVLGLLRRRDRRPGHAGQGGGEGQGEGKGPAGPRHQEQKQEPIQGRQATTGRGGGGRGGIHPTAKVD